MVFLNFNKLFRIVFSGKWPQAFSPSASKNYAYFNEDFTITPEINGCRFDTAEAERLWKETAVGSNFDTFYTERYLTTLHLFQLHDVLAGIPYEHIVILANTDTYGGGGIYTSEQQRAD